MNYCKDCIFWGSLIFVCFKDENEGIRAFKNTPACKYFCKNGGGEISDF